MPQFRLAMHPASEGDALMLSWGEEGALHHALVDLGRPKDYRALKPLLEDTGTFELFAISHIDADHIAGAVPLFNEDALPFKALNVWFNAHAQLAAANDRLLAGDRERLSAGQGEKVTKGIARSGWPWNQPFADAAVISVDSPEAKMPIALAGGLTLTLLSPSDRKLAKLLPVWNDELAKARLRTTDPELVEQALAAGREILDSGLNVDFLAGRTFQIDAAPPNGASIVFIAEFAGKRVLMAADSHPDVVEASLRRLGYSEDRRLKLDCLKVSHHGSRANTSPGLLRLLDCTCFAFSTDGSHHGHPDAETIARILKNDPERQKKLIFNFRQPSTMQWNNEDLEKRWHYDCVFPEAGKEGIEFAI